MSKRTWIMILVVAALAAVLAACGGGELAEDLTPIPTLPPGQTPTLIAALPAEGATEGAAEGQNGDGGEQQEGATQDAGTAATSEAGGEENGGDGAAGDPAVGETIFAETCGGCHGAEPGAGPPVVGMGERAATRVEGMAPEDYLHESIVDPSAYVVEDYQDIMPKNYGEQFSEEELNGLVAYLLQQ